MRLLLVSILVTILPHISDAHDGLYDSIINKYAAAYRISPALVKAIIKVESNFNEQAVGRTHKEVGLMQLHPRYFPLASFDPAANIKMGVKYLAKMRQACYSRYKEAWFICYNTGPNTKRQVNVKLNKYYKKVMNATAHFKKQEERLLYARRVAQSAH